GRQSNSVLRHMLPQILYLVGSTISITWAFTRYWLELSHDTVALAIGSALLLVHSVLAWTVIRRALRPRDYRASWRHPAALHVLYRSVDANGQPVVGQGVTRDINENGVAFVTFTPLTANHEVNLSISGGGQTVHCRGLIRAQTLDVDHRTGRRARAQAYSYRVEFLEPGAEQLEMLWWLGAQFAVSRQYERFGGGQFGVPGEDVRRIPTRDDEQVFELPLTIDLGRQSTLVAVSDTLGPETMTALISEPLHDRATVRFELATPYGSTKGWARVVESESRKIAGQPVYETRFRCERFAGESRQFLQSTIGRQASKDLARVVRLSPARRPSGFRRAATLVAGTTAVAATLVFAGVSVVERDEAAMARIEAGHPVTPEQVDRLVGMVRSVSTASSVNEGELVRLRGAMMRLDRKPDVTTLDGVIARIIPQTLDGQILKGMALQNLRRNKEADEIFSALIAHLDELYNDATRRDVLLAAARNAANLGQETLAVERYARLQSLGALSDDVRDEYAGVLAKAGFADKAIGVLNQGPVTPRSLQLLASIYASQKKFDQAIEVYQRLLKVSPLDLEASRGLADNALWSHDFDTAVRGYLAILARTPGDVAIEGQLAAALLGGRHFDQALAAYAALLDRQPRRAPLIDGFLLAAAGSDKISPSQLRRLSAMFDHRHQFHDERLASHLLNALVRHGTPAQVLPLLEEIVAQKPKDVQLRLQLAGVFDEFHRPAEADRIFAGLLGQLDEFPSIDTRRQVLWAAARNAANRHDFATAAERFAQLRKLGPLSDEAVAEYAGVLVQADHRADAIKLLDESPPRAHTLCLLASIYASEKKFNNAIQAYERLLKESPGDE
ncbi:MAG TPA: tetratricopeptide repeat protein, partial [Pirellulales bacterium]|nr:tetratricopeptide repeat protein [Pirellulales bacterium]